MQIEAHWPLYTILPASSFFFATGYLFVWDRIARSRCGPEQYEKLNHMNQMCFRANCNSLIHTYVVVVMLIWVLATDSTIWTQRLVPYYSPVGYSAMCITLGYFSISVPWSIRMRYWLDGREVMPMVLLIHHGIVSLAAMLYVLSLLACFYGAVAFACMELSNWFFIPRTFAQMLGWKGTCEAACGRHSSHRMFNHRHMHANPCRTEDGRCGTLNGLCLVVSFIVFRIGVCSVVGVWFVADLARWGSADAAEWTILILDCLLFMAVLVISYAWLWLQVLPGLRDGVRQLKQSRRAAQTQRRIEKAAKAASSTSARSAASGQQAAVTKDLGAEQQSQHEKLEMPRAHHRAKCTCSTWPGRVFRVAPSSSDEPV